MRVIILSNDLPGRIVAVLSPYAIELTIYSMCEFWFPSNKGDNALFVNKLCHLDSP